MNNIERLEQQADLLFQNIAGWENSTLQRIGGRIGKIGKMSISDVKALNNIAIVKQDMGEALKELAKVTGMNVSQLEKIYGDVITEQHLKNKPLYDYRGKKFVAFEENRELQSLVRAYARTTGETMINLSKTKMWCTRNVNGQFVNMQKGYVDVLDKAIMQVASGTTDFHTAMRESIVQLGGGGVRVNYGSGITRRLDTVVRQNLLWGVKQASIEYNDMIGEELGCDGIEIDWHSNPRPSHEFMGGKQYVLGEARTINGTKFESADEALERLQDYGCLHFKTPIICGISEPRYSQAELNKLNKQNARTYEIDGKTVSGYEVTQMQRRLEAGIREQKSIKTMAQASGDTLQVRRCNERIKAYQNKYSEITDITGIQGDKKRMSVPKSKNILTSVDKSGIMNTTKENGIIAKPYSEDKIPEKIQNSLNQLKEYGDLIEVDKPYKFEEMALLSRQAGVEFASITVNSKNIIIKGDIQGVTIPEHLIKEIKKHKGILNCHSHAYIGDLRPSVKDIELTKIMSWQKDFYIVTPDMKQSVYNKQGIIEIKDVSMDLNKDEIDLIKKIFGGK